jgi:hypothetical protein
MGTDDRRLCCLVQRSLTTARRVPFMREMRGRLDTVMRQTSNEVLSTAKTRDSLTALPIINVNGSSVLATGDWILDHRRKTRWDVSMIASAARSTLRETSRSIAAATSHHP